MSCVSCGLFPPASRVFLRSDCTVEPRDRLRSAGSEPSKRQGRLWETWMAHSLCVAFYLAHKNLDLMVVVVVIIIIIIIINFLRNSPWFPHGFSSFSWLLVLASTSEAACISGCDRDCQLEQLEGLPSAPMKPGGLAVDVPESEGVLQSCFWPKLWTWKLKQISRSRCIYIYIYYINIYISYIIYPLAEWENDHLNQDSCRNQILEYMLSSYQEKQTTYSFSAIQSCYFLVHSFQGWFGLLWLSLLRDKEPRIFEPPAVMQEILIYLVGGVEYSWCSIQIEWR